MRSEKLALVRRLPLFSAMSAEGFDGLMSAAHLQQFPPATVLIEAGDLPDFLHVVVKGTVELYAASGGRTSTISVLRPVTTFITAAAVQDEPYLMSARTMSAAQILLIPVSAVRQCLETEPRFAQAIVLELARGFRVMVKTLKNHKLRTGVERLASYLLAEDRRQGNSGRLELTFEKRKVASLLGIAPENLSRAFNTLRDFGVVVAGTSVELTDRPALARLAKPDELIDGDEPALKTLLAEDAPL